MIPRGAFLNDMAGMVLLGGSFGAIVGFGAWRWC